MINQVNRLRKTLTIVLMLITGVISLPSVAQVPNVHGMSINEAVSAVRATGYQTEVGYSFIYNTPEWVNRVYDQHNFPGETLVRLSAYVDGDSFPAPYGGQCEINFYRNVGSSEWASNPSLHLREGIGIQDLGIHRFNDEISGANKRWHREISVIDVPFKCRGAVRVALFNHPDFAGDTLWVYEGIDNLGDVGWNDLAHSLRVEILAEPVCQLRLHNGSDMHYEHSYSAKSGPRTEEFRLPPSVDNQATFYSWSGIRACEGASLSFFDSAGYDGASWYRTIAQDIAEWPIKTPLNQLGFGGRISSLKIDWAVPLVDFATGHYSLLAHDGRRVALQSDGTLRATGGPGTLWGLYARNGGQYAIQIESGWLNLGSQGLRANSTTADHSEQHFYFVNQGNGTVGIQNVSGSWLYTNNNSGGVLSTNSAKIYDWWPFSLIGPLVDLPTGRYVLKTHDGRVVTLQGDGSLIAGDPGTVLGVHNRNGGQFAIQIGSGWLNMAPQGLRANSTSADHPDQHFYFFDQGDGSVGIQNAHGAWLFTDLNIGGAISSNSNKINNWWRFTLAPAP